MKRYTCNINYIYQCNISTKSPTTFCPNKFGSLHFVSFVFRPSVVLVIFVACPMLELNLANFAVRNSAALTFKLSMLF